MVDRGQAYTLEGVVAALVVLAGVFFAIQATTAAPQAAGASSLQAEQHDRSLTASELVSADDETIRRALLYWDGSAGAFHCTTGESYYTGAADDSGSCPSSDAVPPLPFGESIADALGPGYTYNVILAYNDTTDRATRRMVYQGEPGDGAIRATTTVVLTDGHNLTAQDGTETDQTLGESGSFYAPDLETTGAEEEHLYNVVHVEVVAWRA